MDYVLSLIALVFVLNIWRRTSVLERDVQAAREEIRSLRYSQRKTDATAAPAAAAAGVWPSDAASSSTGSDHIESSQPETAKPAEWAEGEKDWVWEDQAAPATAPASVQGSVIPDTAPSGEASSGFMRPIATPSRGGFEFNFGKKLPVWIGGIALAFAGFYLVKYSIDLGLLTPAVRVFLGFIFGVGMIGAGSYIRRHQPDMADGSRIAQALTGAGVADLYATIFAATTLFHILNPLAGFAGMAIVTALAVILSVRHGMPIAILGLLGGFLTPVLIQTGHPNAAGLFVYLFMLVIGFFTVITMLSWWVLAVPVLLLSFLWVPVWVFVVPLRDHIPFDPSDGIFLGMFLIAVSAIALFASDKSASVRRTTDPTTDWGGKLGYLAVAGCIGLMALVTSYSDFALEDLGMYALLGTGCLALAWLRPATYGLAPWLSMVASLLMLAIWTHPSDKLYAQVLLGFALLYNVGAFLLLRARPTLKAIGLLSAAAIMFYGLAFARLQEKLYDLLSLEHTQTLHLWGIIAIALASVFTLLTAQFMRLFKGDDSLRQQILAVTVLTATAFLSIALTIEVRHQFLAVAFAAETLAVCWVNLKVDIKALRQVAAILFGVFVALMGEQLLMLCALVVHSLFGQSLDLWNGHLPLAEDPMFQLGLPMAMIGLSSYLIQRHHDGKLAEAFEIATVALGALLMYYLTRQIFRVDDGVMFPPVTFFHRAVMTNLFFAAGLGVVYAGRTFSRRALIWSGTALFVMAMFRVFWFDFLTQNPLLTHQDVGDVFLLNSLILSYLAPCFWLWLEDKPQLRLVTVSPVLRGALMMVLLFTFITLNVRHVFHHPVLSEGTTPNVEIYAYSVVWLLLGGLLLFFGTARKDMPMRRAALALIVGTIGKVFLYDASNLDGLYRVFSFMGLGLSLLALSWFYSRFVFKDKE